jgi:hypothetical protein
VVVFGVVGGASEEIFFRGFMQSRLREHWPPAAAVLAASASFAALHIDISAVHMVLALALGSTSVRGRGHRQHAAVHRLSHREQRGVHAADGARLQPRRAAPNLIAVAAGAIVFVACVLWVARTPAPAPPAPAEGPDVR